MSGHSIEALLRIIKLYWGHSGFRPLQLEAIQATLDKRDVLLVLPTSGGKSLTFQVPALVEAHAVTVVVTPLLALAKARYLPVKHGSSCRCSLAGCRPTF